MKYRPNHIRNPGPGDAARLCNYVTQNDAAVTVDKRGRPIGDDEMAGFYGVTTSAESSGMHTFSFTENIDREKLIDGVREPARDHLDGEYVIGIHEDTDHNHIHIGESGSMDELNMSASDVRGFAQDVASNLGVSYG
jgi:hypothetical protein